MITFPKTYSVNEVAEILSVTRRTVYHYISLQQIKAHKFKGEWQIKESDLQHFIDYGTTDNYLTTAQNSK